MKSKLESIIGISIKKLDIEIEEGGNFIYYEGVFLAHYFNKNNQREHYLYKWCDTDKIVNRWLVYKVNEENLIDFLNKRCSSLELIQRNQYCYFIDIGIDNDKNFNYKNILICAVDTIPKSYLPKSTAFFDEDLYEEYAQELKEKLEKQSLSELRNIKSSLRDAFHSIQKDKKTQLEKEINVFIDSLYKKYAN